MMTCLMKCWCLCKDHAATHARVPHALPGLINGCTIDWFLPWPEEALTSVSGKFIDEFHMACPAETKDQLKLVMGHVHVFVTAACQEYFEKFRRHVYVTPKSYLSFIQGYKDLYTRKWSTTKVCAAMRNTHTCLCSCLLLNVSLWLVA